MNEADREDVVRRYTGRLDQFGYSPEALGWGRHGRQEARFAVLSALALKDETSSVLDVGCGFGDLYEFLRAKGWRGRYTGVDIVPGLLRIARERHPEVDLKELDITTDHASMSPHDFVIASGIFNARLQSGDNRAHTQQVLAAMHQLAQVAVCVDFLSTYVDFQKPEAWHTDPAEALAVGRRLTRRLRLRLDYMPFEFALFLFKNDRVSPVNLFED